ncbi:hypothetical protein I7I50_05898 [Histoplasma capsulatum G186AR]|uniref:Uncharacterized protein n=1 Tax=Ajellomyces capsulatus TaxID=5037 RepID=A0A8H7ZB24_AJECA|nr:hypothetical protein I7I52_04157 [Histoplasma capsulatum]QSS76445.1 hypothetical protein I7I50_05898 [Histoplasma capsulatum G186AR]
MLVSRMRRSWWFLCRGCFLYCCISPFGHSGMYVLYTSKLSSHNTQNAAKKQNGKLRLKYRCYNIHLPGALVSHPCHLQRKPTPALDRRCADYSSNATSRNIMPLNPDRDWYVWSMAHNTHPYVLSVSTVEKNKSTTT